MRKLFKLLSSRLFFTFLFFFFQIGVTFYLLKVFENNYSLTVFSSILGVLVSLLVFSRDEASEYKMSWIFLIMVLPLFGSFMYLVFGNKKTSRWEKRRIQSYKEVVDSHRTDNLPAKAEISKESFKREAWYINEISEFSCYEGTACKYFPLGDEAFGPFIEELSKAEKFIFMEFFIYEEGIFWNKVLSILKEKVAKGVDVRLMYDDMGSIGTLPKNYYKTLRIFGIKAICFNPVKPRLNPRLNYRDHRKICIIDGNTAISGGINIADEYINRKIRFGHWKDNAFMLKGEGVWNYTLMFLQLWSFVAPQQYLVPSFEKYSPTLSMPNDGVVQSFGDSPLDSFNVSENAYIQMLNNAKNYVWISTPYLILDATMTNALTLASQSGVDVRIITPAIPDKKIVYAMTRANYKKLLEYGVRIFEYVPGFIHSKMFVSDDQTAIVGTTNMDYRSFYLHFECGTAFYGGSTIGAVKEDFENTFKHCREVRYEDVSKFSPLKRLANVLSRLVAPLL